MFASRRRHLLGTSIRAGLSLIVLSRHERGELHVQDENHHRHIDLTPAMRRDPASVAYRVGMTRVVIADDSLLIRQGLPALIVSLDGGRS